MCGSNMVCFVCFAAVRLPVLDPPRWGGGSRYTSSGFMGGGKIAGQSKNVSTLTLLLTEAICILVNLQRCHHGVVL